MPICTVHLFPEMAHRQFRKLTQRYPLSFTELVCSCSWQANWELRLCLTTHRVDSYVACGSRLVFEGLQEQRPGDGRVGTQEGAVQIVAAVYLSTSKTSSFGSVYFQFDLPQFVNLMHHCYTGASKILLHYAAGKIFFSSSWLDKSLRILETSSEQQCD